MLRFETVANCNCQLAPKFSEQAFTPRYTTGLIEAFLLFKGALLLETYFAIHLNKEHINNIFVDGISLRRLV